MALTKTPIELSSTPSIVDGGNATAITIDSSENVGIGTGANPISHQLVSYKTGANANYIQIASGATGIGATNGFRLGVSSAGLGEIYSQSASPTMTFSSGNVGIGRVPRVMLDVAGEAAIAYNATYGLRFYNQSQNNWSFIGNDVTTSGADLRLGDSTGEVMRLSGGNVGIGQSAPYNNSKLDVVGSIISTSQTIGTYAANNAGFDYAAGTKIGRFFSTSSDATGGHMTFITGAGGGAERMRIDSSGNLLVGRTGDSGLGKLQVYGGADIAGGDVYLARDTGNLLVGTTSATAKLIVDAGLSSGETIRADNSQANYAGVNIYSVLLGSGTNSSNPRHFQCYAEGAIRFVVQGNGAVYGNGTYGTYSDLKLKENIVLANSQWDDIKAVQLKNYSMKEDGLSEANQLGVIAQDLEASGMQKLIEEMNDKDADGNLLGTTTKHVKYSILHLKALGALQEAMTRIETLEAKVQTLENT